MNIPHRFLVAVLLMLLTGSAFGEADFSEKLCAGTRELQLKLNSMGEGVFEIHGVLADCPTCAPTLARRQRRSGQVTRASSPTWWRPAGRAIPSRIEPRWRICCAEPPTWRLTRKKSSSESSWGGS